MSISKSMDEEIIAYPPIFIQQNTKIRGTYVNKDESQNVSVE